MVNLIFILIILPTTLYLYLWRFYDLSRHGYPFYLYREEATAMQWLEQNTPQDSIVLSSYDIGMYLPGISGRLAFLSHWAQTVNFLGKKELVEGIYKGEINKPELYNSLKSNKIQYVFYGPAEHFLGDFPPEKTDYLTEVYRSENVKIYMVK
jgi:hypothetical protein